MNAGGASPETPCYVVICDDEARLAALTAGLLEDHGYRLKTFRRGEHVLTELEQARVDLLLLDVNLAEGMTAREVLDALDAQEASTRVILTSGLAEEDVPEDLIDHVRVIAYLPKPYSVEALVEAVETAIDG